jgi:hypothetical protein
MSKSCGSEVGTSTDYGLDDWAVGVRVTVGSRINTSPHRSDPISGTNPASHPMGTGGSFPGGKAAWAWSWTLTSNKCRGQEKVNPHIHPHPHLHTSPRRNAQLVNHMGNLIIIIIRYYVKLRFFKTRNTVRCHLRRRMIPYSNLITEYFCSLDQMLKSNLTTGHDRDCDNFCISSFIMMPSIDAT